jgi:hypothetical protein
MDAHERGRIGARYEQPHRALEADLSQTVSKGVDEGAATFRKVEDGPCGRREKVREKVRCGKG